MWWKKGFLSKTIEVCKPLTPKPKNSSHPRSPWIWSLCKEEPGKMRAPALHAQKDNPHQLEEQELCCCVLRTALDAFESQRLWLLGSLGDPRTFLKAGIWVTRISSSWSSGSPRSQHLSCFNHWRGQWECLTPKHQSVSHTHAVKRSFQSILKPGREMGACSPSMPRRISLKSSCKWLHKL